MIFSQENFTQREISFIILIFKWLLLNWMKRQRHIVVKNREGVRER